MLRKITISILIITAYFFVLNDNVIDYAMAKVGRAQAQYDLGTRYHRGTGVTQDYQQAFTWYTKAAEQGHNDAQFSLATMYYKGEGVTANNQLAIMWVTKSAENGSGLAQVLLATAYATGKGLAQDWKKAYMWFSVYAVTDPSPTHLSDASSHLTPAEISEAQASAAALIKQIEVNKAHKK